MSHLPCAVYSAAQVRQLDLDAIERQGIPGYELMCRAGAAALRILRRRWPHANRIVVVCGSGNNGGDGYVLARLALQSALQVTTIALSAPNALRGDALTAYRAFISAGGHVSEWSEQHLSNADVVVDSLFGIGLSRPLEGSMLERVRALNACGKPILAIDVPSGLHADTGRVLGGAIRAECTVTFIGLKLGFYVGVGPDYTGEIEFDDLGVDSSNETEVAATRIDSDWLRANLPKRSKLAHKGSNGHVLAIGGGPGMAGAVRLTAEACLRVGAGLVTVATCAQNVAAIVIDRPELIVRGVSSADELTPLLSKADVVVIGPGLGQDDWSRSLLVEALRTERRLVIDADALNLLAKHPRRSAAWILTPHPGEASRLLSSTTADVQANRIASATSLAEKYGGVAVLKGAHTVIARANERPVICDAGNPAMATPGMGDVLAGVIAGLYAQVEQASLAAELGVAAHAVAADRAAARLGGVDRGLIASDLFAELPACVSS